MQKVDSHITELLYEHDCVIVPGFGGFLANYTSAKIHPTQHLFSPPSKHIVFNKNLKNNDGLLANQITRCEKINYSEALDNINIFVQRTNASLKKGEKVKIDSVGIVYLDAERNIQFKPGTTNFLTEAFGLTEFQSPTIKQDTIGKRVEKGLTKESPKVIDINATPKRKINIKRVIAVAASVTFISGIFWISLKTDVLKNVNYSNLNPFASKGSVNDTIVINTKNKIVSKTPVYSDVDTFATTTIPEPVTATLIKAELVKADSTRVAKANETPISKRFHLVTGCFQIEENAIKFVDQLKKENVESVIIGKNKRGLYVVSCGDFNSKAEAETILQTLRKVQPNAWLYKSN